MNWREINPNYKHLLEDLKNKTPYEILQVYSSSSLEEIKDAYKKLVRTYHPDGSDKFMKSLNAEILKYINLAYEKIIEEKNK